MKKRNKFITLALLVIVFCTAIPVLADGTLPDVPIGGDEITYERKAATCTQDGYRITYKGGVEVQRVTYPAAGHSYENGVCTVCGKVFMYADADSDDSVNLSDVTLITRHVAQWNGLPFIDTAVCDVNTNGGIALDDVTLITRYVAQWSGVTLG